MKRTAYVIVAMGFLVLFLVVSMRPRLETVGVSLPFSKTFCYVNGKSWKAGKEPIYLRAGDTVSLKVSPAQKGLWFIDGQIIQDSLDTNLMVWQATETGSYTITFVGQKMSQSINFICKVYSPIPNLICEEAKKHIGTPYVLGGSSWKRGIDCSAFVQRLYRDIGGVELPRTSYAMAHCEVGSKISTIDSLQQGDLVFFASHSNSKRIGHVGIYLGNGKFIHSTGAKHIRGVAITSIKKRSYQRRFCFAKRIIGDNFVKSEDIVLAGQQ